MRVQDILEGIVRLRNYLRTGGADCTGYTADQLDKYLNIRRYGDLTLVNYTNAAQYDAEWNSFLRVCRGIVLDKQLNLVSMPFHKFFNIDECDETAIKNVSGWRYRSMTEKVDGVMIQVFRHEGELVFASRHGINTEASVLARQLACDIDRVIDKIPFPRFTLIMELIHPEVWQPGMIYYDNRMLVPLFVRDLDTLELYPSGELFHELPPSFILPDRYLYEDVRNLVKVAREYGEPDWEGVVVQGHGELGNQLVKIKTFGYIKRLQLLRGISPRRIIQVYREQGMEGVKQIIADVEEIVLSSPKISETIDSIKREEENILQEAQKYADITKERITEVPVEWRWVVGYRGSPKFDGAIRKRVATRVELMCKDEEQE